MARTASTKKEPGTRRIRSQSIAFLTPELLEVQGKNDRELLTLRVKLLLDAKEKFPHEPSSELANLADLSACGCGSCCCCDALILPGSEVILPG